MKTPITMKTPTLIFFLFITSAIFSQVGINTTTPKEGSLLDVDSTDKGIYIPKVDISDLSTIAPITDVTVLANAESLLVYNTNPTTGKGYYYWDSTKWVQLEDLNSVDDWRLLGNANTTPGTGANQNYIGTSDDQDLIIAENTTERIKLTSQETVFNDIADSQNFRIETDDETHMFYVDGTNDRIGITTNNPQTALHVAGANNVVRIESLNSTNDINNNGTDPSVVMVNTDGDLFLSPSVNKMVVDASDTGTGVNAFMTSPIVVLTASNGGLNGIVAHTHTFTLTRETLVEVAFYLGVQFQQQNGTLISDGKPRLAIAAINTETGLDVAYETMFYTNSSTAGTVTTGFYTLSGSGFVTLSPGTHTLTLRLYIGGGETTTGDTADAQGCKASFNSTFNKFQIVYHN